MNATPPGPIWADWNNPEGSIGAAVYVNGGLVEINLADGWSGRLIPAEATKFAADLQAAVAEACSWAERWDGTTRTYREVVA